MTKTNIRRLLKAPLTYVGIGVMAAIIAAFVFVAHPAAAPQNGASDNEVAYQNVIYSSLKVYKARYAKYPDSYQALLSDMNVTPDIYGVNEEGMTALQNITAQLQDFSYLSTSGGDGYQFTYRHHSDGGIVTINNK